MLQIFKVYQMYFVCLIRHEANSWCFPGSIKDTWIGVHVCLHTHLSNLPDRFPSPTEKDHKGQCFKLFFAKSSEVYEHFNG